MESIRIMIASPGDVNDERINADRIISDFKDVIRGQGYSVETFRWEVDSYPSFHKKGPQGKIDEIAKITDLDIFVGIFWSKLGSKLPNSNETGTEHEFRLAYEGWKKNSKPNIMFYFKNKAIPLADKNILKSSLKVMEFKENFPVEGLYWEYEKTSEFERLFNKHIMKAVFEIINSRRTSQRIISSPEEQPEQVKEKTECIIDDLNVNRIDELIVSPDSEIHTSFHPERKENLFLRIKVPTTNGFVRYSKNEEEKEISNEIFIIRDPIRPFEIQIGETRSKRPGASPGFIVLEDGLTLEGIKRMYPFILDENDTWLRTVFAELATNPEVLQFIYDKDPSDFVKKIASTNPNASN